MSLKHLIRVMSENLQRMLDTYFGIVRQVSRILDFVEDDLTLQEIRILEFVEEFSKNTMGQLSEQFPLPASTATRFVDKLVRKDYLERERLETDRRQVMISVSQKGSQLLKKRTNRRNSFFQKMFSELTQEDIVTLSQIFRKLSVPKDDFPR